MRSSQIIIGLFAFFTATQAFAHATPTQYEPEAGTLMKVMPEMIRIHFTERVEPSASFIRVFSEDGTRVEEGSATVDTENPRLLSVPVKKEKTGVYTVAWNVISADDGHFSKGAYSFSFGEGEMLPSPTISQEVEHRSPWLLAVFLWMELLWGAVVLGGLALLLLWRSGDSFSWSRLRAVLWLGLIAMIIGTVGAFAFEGITLAEQQDIGVIDAMKAFAQTTSGQFTIYRFIIAAICSVWLLLRLQKLRKIDQWALFFLLIITALLRARVSHAAASTFLPGVSIVTNAVHLLAKDLWIGGLLMLITIALPSLDRKHNDRGTVNFLLSLQKLFIIALCVGGVTAAYITWLHLKTLESLLTTHWGGYFLNLSFYAIVFLLLRLHQQLVVLPALVRKVEGTSTFWDEEHLKSTGAFHLLEAAIGVAILLFSSMLIITTPPHPEGLYEKSVSSGNSTVTLREDAKAQSFSLRASPVEEGAPTTITLENKTEGIGPIEVELERHTDGSSSFSKTSLSPAGQWTIAFTQQRAEGYDVVAHFNLTIPDDLLAAREGAKERRFDAFALTFILVAIAIIILCTILWVHVSRLQNRAQLIGSHSSAIPALSCRRLWLALAFDLVAVTAIGLTAGFHIHDESLLTDSAATTLTETVNQNRAAF